MNWEQSYNQWTMPFGGFVSPAFWGVLLGAVLVWSLVWKGLALWRAAQNGSKPWFIALLLINTAGILDILYLFVFGKKSGTPGGSVQI